MPRGSGYWFFSAHREGVDFDKHADGKDFISGNASYTDAKARAKS